MTEKELQALIQLLDDPDDGIYAQVEGKLKTYGSRALPLLESAYHKQSLGDLFVQRIERLMNAMADDQKMDALRIWLNSENNDLIEGLVIVNQLINPDVQLSDIQVYIDKLVREIWLELHDDLTGIEKLRILNHFIFEVHGFKGNVERYHHLNNSCLDKVIEHKTGNPLLISSIYLAVAKKLDIPLYGINLPQHFILGYVDTSSPLLAISDKEQPEVLFFIDPFSGGNLFALGEVKLFAEQLKVETKPEFFIPCDHVVMVKRCLTNMLYSLKKQKSYEKIDQIKKAIRCIKEAEL